jgi:CYTH domain-containing protein
MDLRVLGSDRASHPDAPPGKAGKYAIVERERRFLLATSPAGTPMQRILIEDRYLRRTRLRLRRMTDLDEQAGAVTYKLTQKVPTPTGVPRLITTMYLSAVEFETFADLPGDTLRKVRSAFPPLGVDTFEGPLRGLVVAEAEFETATEEASFPPPDGTVAEVTSDVRFTGGNLVRMSAEMTAALLAAFGLGL